jgi:hypothetical protein
MSDATWSPIVEFRQYTLHPGARDTLIELFDREFIESQEELGMKVIGQFRPLDDTDRFIWLRGYPDMQTRARALAAFYDGPVWAQHRDVANATMIDSDNVLLLRPQARGAVSSSTGSDLRPGALGSRTASWSPPSTTSSPQAPTSSSTSSTPRWSPH